MIGNLLETATEIHIALPWDPNPVARDLEVFHLTATTMDAIKAIGARAQVSFKVEKISSVHQKKPELAHLEANLFCLSQAEIPGSSPSNQLDPMPEYLGRGGNGCPHDS